MRPDLIFNTELLFILHKRWKEQPLNQSEQELLDHWLTASPFNQQALLEAADETWLEVNLHDWERQNAKAIWDNVQFKIHPGTPVHRVHFLKAAWFRYAAAAILVFILGSVAWLWKTQEQNSPLVQTNPAPMQNDVPAPSLSRATLTLASGKQIFIDSSMNGTLATQGNVNIQKMNDGRIVYNGKGEVGQIQYNTFTVPRGSQIASIVLSDGSKVFLNAASSLTYPVTFIGNERKVAITGEAYFEVAKDPSKKFIVSGSGISTEVLGTHFNVNTYSDEGAIKVTLLEGSVKVIGGESNVVIKPGAQAEFTRGVMQVNQSVDVEQVMAWKNGVFNFNRLPLKDAMRQLSRWYNLEIVYENHLPTINFYGEIGKDLKLSQVLNGLSGLGIKFRIDEGNRLVVSKD